MSCLFTFKSWPFSYFKLIKTIIIVVDSFKLFEFFYVIFIFYFERPVLICKDRGYI